MLLRKKYTIPKYSIFGERFYSDLVVHPECKERPRNPYYDPFYEESVWSLTPRSMLGKKRLVTMAAGVGIGPEMMEVVKRVCLIANAPVIFEEISLGEDDDVKDMDNLIYSIERNGVAIKGDIQPKLTVDQLTDFSYTTTRNLYLRRSLDLYANLIEFKSFPGFINKTRLKKDVDVVLVRQNLEGGVSMLEHSIGRGIEHLSTTTRYNTRRLAEFAFKYATEHKRRQVVAVYNAEVMEHSERLFLDTLVDVASDYPDVKFSKQDMHNFIYDLSALDITGDVLVTNALYGSMIASLLFGLTKGAGLFCAQNMGARYVVFEPAARNKGYKLAGKDVVNPVAALACAISMLRHLGLSEAAGRIDLAVRLTVDEDQVHTADMLGTAACSQVVANVERRLQEVMPEGYNRPLPPYKCGDKAPISKIE